MTSIWSVYVCENVVQPELIDQGDKQEKTPLFLSVENDHTACVEYLLEKGADPNRGNQDRETALHKGNISNI